MSSTPITPLTNAGKLSLKPKKGRSWKRLRRIAIVAELEKLFISDAEIANHLGLTVAAIQAIKSTPEFLAKRISLQTGVLSIYEQRSMQTEEDMKDALDELVPTAINSVRAILLDKTHKDHARVAVDMLDRNTATSKISRTQHSVAPPPNTSKEDAQARELLAILQGSVEPPQLPSPPSPQILVTPEDSQDELGLESQPIDELESDEDNEPRSIVVM